MAPMSLNLTENHLGPWRTIDVRVLCSCPWKDLVPKFGNLISKTEENLFQVIGLLARFGSLPLFVKCSSLLPCKWQLILPCKINLPVYWTLSAELCQFPSQIISLISRPCTIHSELAEVWLFHELTITLFLIIEERQKPHCIVCSSFIDFGLVIRILVWLHFYGLLVTCTLQYQLNGHSWTGLLPDDGMLPQMSV